MDACACDAVQFLFVVRNAGTKATHGEAWAHDQRITELFGDLVDFFNGVCDVGTCGFCTSFLNDLFEELTILAAIDGFQRRPISSTLYFLSTPASPNAMAAFSAVWPPKVGSSASGRSLAMICSRIGVEIGSM